MMPLDVDCPRCGRKADWPCVTVDAQGQPTHHHALTHAVRWKTAGIPKPNHDDRQRNLMDIMRRDSERILLARQRSVQPPPR